MQRILLSLVFAVLLVMPLAAGEWIFVGPDSAEWRETVQMDVSFRAGRQPIIGAATNKGICIRYDDGTWKYVMPDITGQFFPPEDTFYRAIFFSPWDDSTAYIGSNYHYSGEPASSGGTTFINHTSLLYPSFAIGGGFIGYNPSLAFEMSPHHPGWVYSWMIGFYKSFDGGLQWEQQPMVEAYGAAFLTFDQRRDSVLYAGINFYNGSDGYELNRSTDDGQNWISVRPIDINPYPSQRAVDLWAAGDTLMLWTNRFPQVADSTCGITVSYDGGNSWNWVLPNSNVLQVIPHHQSDGVFYAAVEGGIYRSNNWGEDWFVYNNTLPSLNIVDLKKDPFSDTLYAATSDLGIYQVYDTDVAIGVTPQVAEEFILRQNYPNPFNPSTTIEFELPAASAVTLEIYDNIGRHIKTPYSASLPAGTHKFVWDATDAAGNAVASGVYYYRLQSGDFQYTRKMLLIR